MLSLNNLHDSASELLAFFDRSKIFCFNGTLGSGKTTFISAICRHLGTEDLINSPTFSLVNEYKTDQGIVFHFDLYRLKSLEEALDIGFEEYIDSSNYCFIEWPQKITAILPSQFVVYCELSYVSPTERILKAWANY